MRWYWIIIEDNVDAKPFLSQAADLKGYEDWELRQGKRIVNWDSSAWIQATEPQWDGAPDDALHNDLALPIFSARLQRLILEAGFTGIQFLPIHVLHRDGREIFGYSIANILNIPAVMDREKSTYDVFEDDYPDPEDRGKIEGIYEMALKGSALNGYDIIRPQEYLGSLYASERFKKLFEGANCTGYLFKEVEVS